MSADQIEALDVLAMEALYLDERRWDDWIGLYTQDCVFWVPTWLNEDQQSSDPETQLSFIYLEGIAALKERVWRIQSGLSRASGIRHRTVHVQGRPLVLEGATESELRILSAGSVHVFNPEQSTQSCFFARYEHNMRRTEGGSWQIARKHVKLMNDCIPTMLDIQFV